MANDDASVAAFLLYIAAGSGSDPREAPVTEPVTTEPVTTEPVTTEPATTEPE